MRNLLNEKPTDKLHGRLLFTSVFIPKSSIAGKRVLDIGCGYGWLELWCLNNEVKQVVGIEPRQSALETAVRYLPTTDRLVLKVADALSLPFDDCSFDTVICLEVMEHLPKGTELKLLSEVQRVLIPGGILYLSTPFRSTIATLLDPAWWLVRHRHYTMEQVISLIFKAGLVPKNVVLRGGMWEIVGMLDLYISKWVFRRQAFFADAISRYQDKEWLTGATHFTNIFSVATKQ